MTQINNRPMILRRLRAVCPAITEGNLTLIGGLAPAKDRYFLFFLSAEPKGWRPTLAMGRKGKPQLEEMDGWKEICLLSPRIKLPGLLFDNNACCIEAHTGDNMAELLGMTLAGKINSSCKWVIAYYPEEGILTARMTFRGKDYKAKTTFDPANWEGILTCSS